MSVTIAEYLGQRTDVDRPIITPLISNEDKKTLCPFVDKQCEKLKKGNKPVCSVRKSGRTLWIVCPHRLCSTTSKIKIGNKSKYLPLCKHQQDILWQVAKTIYRGDFQRNNVAVSREVAIPLGENSSTYHADYIMRNLSPGAKVDEILLEIQGGGETSSTGAITRKIGEWEKLENPTNIFLRESVGAGTIETNAWRRQQEQFLVKGNVVSQTGGKLVFAVGTLLFDYLQKKFDQANLRDLKQHNWTLCLLAFKEDTTEKPSQGAIPLIVDQDRLLFTNYSTFVRFLTDQGGPLPQIFEGTFETLTGPLVEIKGTVFTPAPQQE